jgi:rod shape-determining protein MreD
MTVSTAIAVSFRRSDISPYLYVPLLALVAVLQATVAPHLTVLGARPDLMLLTVVAWALLRGTREGMVWGFVGGLLLSLFSGGPFAYAALVLVAVGFLSGLGQTTVTRGRIVLPLLAVLLATLLHGLLSLFLLYVTGRPVMWLDSLVRVLLPAIVLNCLLSIPVYAGFRRLHRRMGPEELRW